MHSKHVHFFFKQGYGIHKSERLKRVCTVICMVLKSKLMTPQLFISHFTFAVKSGLI